MKKKNLWHIAAIAMITMVCIGTMSSCSKDDDEVKNDGYEQTENVSIKDPEGTIVVNMESGADGNYYKIGNLCEIHIDAANNFQGNNNNGYTIEFVTIGKVDGLSKIDYIPTSGWAKSVAVVAGTGYVMRYSHSGKHYARIYVVDYLGQTYTDEQGNNYGTITGATIKYQEPFQLPIKLDVTSLSFDSGAESKKIELGNPTDIVVEEKPEWCTVSVTESSITISVTENLTAEQRQGDIVLKNTSNSVKISVTQKGASSPLFQAGSGTTDDPYQIRTADQLKSITKALNAHFILTADITLNEEVNGSGWDPIGKHEAPFTGSIDGKGHTIKNLWMKRPTTDGVGLFGYVKNATITGVRLEIGNNGLNGGNYVGGICGHVGDATISKCSVKGAISGKEYVGGVCGYVCGYITYSTGVSQCFSEGTLTGNSSVGGIIGGFPLNSYFNISMSISDCYSTISLSASSCYGISRISQGGSVTKCYYAGKASLTSSGGYFYCPGTYTYYDQTIIGTAKLASETNARTTSQMKTQSNYEGWDFTNTWKITEGKTYPTLRCFDK